MVRTGLLMILFNGSAGVFLYDAYIRYARSNAVDLVKSLGLDPDSLPAIDSGLTVARAHEIIQQIEKRTEFSTVTSILGEPALRHGDDVYYLGPGGSLRLAIERDRVTTAEWTDGVKSETDQQWQRWIGYGLAAIGVVLIVQFARVLTTRVSLTDEGLQVRGKPLIPFDAMTALRCDPKGRGGRVELAYTLAGRGGLVRLDDYVVKEQPAIVTAICGRKGFANPLDA